LNEVLLTIGMPYFVNGQTMSYAMEKKRVGFSYEWLLRIYMKKGY